MSTSVEVSTGVQTQTKIHIQICGQELNTILIPPNRINDKPKLL